MFKKIKISMKIVFVFTSCLLFLFFVVGLFYNPYGLQRNIFFAGMDDFLMDFFNVLRIIGDRNPYFNTVLDYGDKAYFPLTYMILYPFSQLDNFNAMTREEPWNSKMGLISAFIFIGFIVFLLFLSLNNICKKYLIPPPDYKSCFKLYFLFFH